MQKQPERRKKKKKEKHPSAYNTDLGALPANQVVDGMVDAVESYGVFVLFWWKKDQFRGFCHRSDFAEENANHPGFAQGDLVRLVVTKVDEEKKRVTLSMRPSAFPSDWTDFKPKQRLPTPEKGRKKGPLRFYFFYETRGQFNGRSEREKEKIFASR